jgi:hypothetical protein
MTSRAGKKPPAANAAAANAAAANAADDLRCLCGSLVARLVDGGVEIKCRRCQRLVLLPLEEDAGAPGPRP